MSKPKPQTQPKPQSSAPKYIMPTYIGVLSEGIARAMNAVQQTYRNVRKVSLLRSSVMALWNILTPDVRRDVAEKLGASHPDAYVARIEKEKEKKLWSWLNKRHGYSNLAHCLEIEEEEMIKRLKGMGIEPKKLDSKHLYRSLFECPEVLDDVKSVERSLLSAKADALDKVLRTIIDALYYHGWLVKAEATRLGRER